MHAKQSSMFCWSMHALSSHTSASRSSSFTFLNSEYHLVSTAHLSFPESRHECEMKMSTSFNPAFTTFSFRPLSTKLAQSSSHIARNGRPVKFSLAIWSALPGPVEETSAVKDELARVSNANVSLERRLARARAEVAAARAELAARGDAVDEAMARNARNAAVAAREVLRRADRNDDDDRLREVSFLHPSSRENGDDFLLTKYSVSRRQTPFAPRDANDDRARSSAPPSPSPTTISHTSRTRAASRGPNDGSFSFPKDKPGENEDDARRQKTDSVDASDATMTTKEEESVVGSRALAAAEARAARLARLNAVLLDRLGDVIGAAPRAERRDEETETETETETVVSTTRRASDDASLRALESEVKAMDAEYRETMATIASMTSVSNARYGGLASDIAAARAIDAAAARANALEDAIVRKVEEVQRLRDEASASSEK